MVKRKTSTEKGLFLNNIGLFVSARVQILNNFKNKFFQ